MKTITDFIRDHVQTDLVAHNSLQSGVLNLRAYARVIRPQIELQRQEKIDIATMAVALSRIEKEIQQKPGLLPDFSIIDMTLQAPLCDITYRKDRVSQPELTELSKLLRGDNKEFVTITQSFREITVIAPARYRCQIEQLVAASPIYAQTDLFAATIHFSVDYLEVSNVVYSLLASIAVYNVNLIEIVSTASELSLIIQKDDVENVTAALHKFL